MKKQNNSILQIFIRTAVIGIGLICLCLFIPVVSDCFSTASKLERYLKVDNIEKIKNLNLELGINGYYDYKTPLIYAVEENNIKAIKYFIEQGADVNLKGTGCFIVEAKPKRWKHCFSPLQIAEKTGNAEIIELLKSAGAKK